MNEQPNSEYLQLLAHKIKEGTLTQEELSYFKKWYNSQQDTQAVFPEDYAASPMVVRERMLKEIQARIQESKAKERSVFHRIPLWIKILSAAILFLISLLFVYKFRQGDRGAIQHQSTQQIIKVAPGGNAAVLTLANGNTINLNELANGNVAAQTGASISKTEGGQLIYTPTQNAGISGERNMIQTPRGGQYRLRLPDNTEVWLNAASSLKYPVSFKGRGERRVEVSGEAYFQVAKDKAHPFVVKTSDQEVTVLGTHFNINSYPDEGGTKTTLEEGSVRVRRGAQTVVIHPGQEARNTTDGKIVTAQADLETVLGWKNGLLVFNDADIESVMRQVSRWYNIDIEFKGTMTREVFSGGIPRDSDLGTVLKIFESSHIRFNLVQGRNRKKLIINP